MRKSLTTMTLTCDRCNEEVGKLTTIYKDRNNYDPYGSYEPLSDLCDVCWSEMTAFLKGDL